MVGYFLLRNYPLTEARAYEIKQLLAARRGEATIDPESPKTPWPAL